MAYVLHQAKGEREHLEWNITISIEQMPSIEIRQKSSGEMSRSYWAWLERGAEIFVIEIILFK